MLMKNKQTDY